MSTSSPLDWKSNGSKQINENLWTISRVENDTLGVFARASRTGLPGGKKNDQSLAPLC